jgi:cell division protein ZapA (FtsZ GTPase activity inhibitor)
MSKETKESVELVIAGRSYPVVTTASDRARLEAIAESINQQLLDIQLQYADRDRQDCLAMSLLRSSVELDQAQRRLASLSAKISGKLS